VPASQQSSQFMRGTTLTQSVAIQSRVIYALVMREVITRYGRNNIGFLWMFLHPMLFTACIAYIWSFTKGSLVSSIPVATFALTGYSATLLWRQTSSRCIKALESNAGLLWHRNVTPLDVYLARIILEIAGSSVSLCVLTTSFCFVGKIPPPTDIVTIVCGWSLLSVFSLALGILVGNIGERSKIFRRIWGIFTLAIFPFSGVFMMVDWAPQKYQKILLLVPMVHSIEMIREGFCGKSVHAHYSFLYITFFNGVLLFFALALNRLPRNKANPE